LHDNVVGVALRIGVLDRDRDWLSLFVNAKDDRLFGLLFPGVARSFAGEELDTGR
jgi:hypothetical protein